MTEPRDVFAALRTAGREVDRVLAGLSADQWALPTPAPDWTIAHQVAHLAATFRMAGLAGSDPDLFQQIIGTLSPDFDVNVRHAMAPFLAEPPDALLRQWQAEWTRATDSLAAVPADQVVPWLVNPPPAVLASAGLMELFGHGQDIADALGIHLDRTDDLAFLVGFAVRTWDFGYQSRGLHTPDVQIRFEVTGPSGALWTFGPADATNRVIGPAEDFCLLVTRRRHPEDLALTTVGEVAREWVEIAQAYRGPSGEGRQPGQFAAVRQ
ncbi:TIGR03084 family metal-binding protein [Kibdelosporangium lantanae]